MATKKGKTSKVNMTAKKVTSAQSKKVVRSMPLTVQKAESLKMQNISWRSPKILVPLFILVLIVIAFLVRGFFIAAIVNGQPISRISVDRQLEKQGGQQILQQIITQKLIEQEASKRHVTVSQSEINTSLKTIDDSVKKQGQTLDSALLAKGMTKQDLINQIRIQKLLEKMLGASLKVTDQEVSDYIDKNKDTLPQGLSDDEMKATVRQQLEQQKLQGKAQTLIQNLQAAAKISYFVKF